MLRRFAPGRQSSGIGEGLTSDSCSTSSKNFGSYKQRIDAASKNFRSKSRKPGTLSKRCRAFCIGRKSAVFLLCRHRFEHGGDVAGGGFQPADQGVHVVVLFGQYGGEGFDAAIKSLLIFEQLRLDDVEVLGASSQDGL
ncbi:hypothetical protein D3C80_1754630 [compost metagenome]